jgi:tetratricopeptide (TPR) repeat protein
LPLSLRGHLSQAAGSFQRVLAHDPRNVGALVGLSLVALASGQTDAAVRMAHAAVGAEPLSGTAWVTLGQSLKSAGRTTEAGTAYEQALRLEGTDSLARMGVAELKIALDQPDAAICEYELVLRRNPAFAPAHLGLGHALACLGKYAEALERYQDALLFQPRLAEAEFAAGFALARLLRPREAETRYRRALVLQPDFAAAWMNLGCLLRERGRDLSAEAALRRAVVLRPDLVSGWINLALLERERGNPAAAAAHLRTAFALNPDQIETLVAWCQFRVAERDFAGAWEWLRWALARNSAHGEAVNMNGILLHTEGRFGEAVTAFERAEALGSRHAASNRGNALLDLGRVDDALLAHQSAVVSDAQNAGARYNLSLTQLRMGDWRRGWSGYESRWSFREVHRCPRSFPHPRWCGEPLDGRRVLLHAEQGLGDTIQFCRYAALVAARGGFPIVQVQAPVQRLLHSLAVVRCGQAEIALLGETPPAFDLECPLMSLPALFGTTVDTVPWPGPYLSADPEDAAAIALRSAPARTRGAATLRVGIAWAGNPRYKADRQRSMQLEALLPLLRIAGIHWVSLQKGEAAEQLSKLPGDVSVEDGSSGDRDLADTAAIVASLDLVITTDTCIAHLAGAMGKSVWILLSHLADWRWMQELDTTPWYPTARLFRQAKRGDWLGVLTPVVTRLRSQTSPHASP